MEASTQPQPAVPSPVAPSITETKELPKRSKWPLIISLLLFFIVIIALAALFLMTRNSGGATNNTQSTVSAPVTQVTTTTPETTSGSTITPPPVADASLSPNNFDSRLFYLNFISPNPITTDTTTRITHQDGTTWCFDEQATGQDIAVNIFTGAADCHGAVGAAQENKFDLTSADSKVVNFVVSADASTGKFVATGVYSTQSPLALTFIVSITGNDLVDVKAKATALTGTLSFDTSMMKTELTDKITTPSYGQP